MIQLIGGLGSICQLTSEILDDDDNHIMSVLLLAFPQYTVQSYPSYGFWFRFIETHKTDPSQRSHRVTLKGVRLRCILSFR